MRYQMLEIFEGGVVERRRMLNKASMEGINSSTYPPDTKLISHVEQRTV